MPGRSLWLLARARLVRRPSGARRRRRAATGGLRGPGIFAVSAPQRVATSPVRHRCDARVGRVLARASAPRGIGGSLPLGTLRRPAPTGGAGPGAVPAPPNPAARRALFLAGRAGATGTAKRTAPSPARNRTRDRAGFARPGRGRLSFRRSSGDRQR